MDLTLTYLLAFGSLAAFDRSGLTFFAGAAVAFLCGGFLVYFAATFAIGMAYAVYESTTH